MLGQQRLERAEGLFRMRLARAMGQSRALQLHIPKHRAYGDVVMPPAMAYFAAVWAASEPKQSIVGLLLDHSFLDFLQDQLTFRQSEAEGFYDHTLALELGYILHLLLPGVAHRDEFEAQLHALPALRPAR